MSQRYIGIPEPIQAMNRTKSPPGPLEGPNGKVDQPWSLYRFVAIFIAQRKEWQKPLTRARQMASILLLLETAHAGKIVPLGEDLWRELQASLNAADFELPFPYNVQLLPLADAILDAGTDAPGFLSEVG